MPAPLQADHQRPNCRSLERTHVKLNLGCGTDMRLGYVNVDWKGGDVVWELNKFPWPWATNSVDEILMWHVLEHLPDTTATLTEVVRVLKRGAIWWGQVPYGPSHDGRTHWQHVRHFVARSFHQIEAEFPLKVLVAQNGVHACSWRHRLRNAVPFRESLALAGWSEAFDLVNFKLVRL